MVNIAFIDVFLFIHYNKPLEFCLANFSLSHTHTRQLVRYYTGQLDFFGPECSYKYAGLTNVSVIFILHYNTDEMLLMNSSLLHMSKLTSTRERCIFV